jgi:molybdopterin molybdotransferase
VRFETAPSRGDHIRRRGESVRAGTVLLARGRRIRSGDLALAALAGADPLTVVRRPAVRIVTTGNELVESSSLPGAGQLRDSNGPMLRAACAARGWAAKLERAVRDEPGTVAALFAGSAKDTDVLLTCGGISAGDLDLLPAAAAAAGFSMLFARVAMKPGKPVHLARRGDTLWFGLPGNPVSAAVTFHLFAREALARLEGDGSPSAPRVSAHLQSDLRPGGAREAYREGLWGVAEGRSRVEPLSSRGSHDLPAYARANALIRIAAGAPAQPAGSTVECILIDETPVLAETDRCHSTR